MLIFWFSQLAFRPATSLRPRQHSLRRGSSNMTLFRRALLSGLLLVFLVPGLLSPVTNAQEKCLSPIPLPVPTEPNIFTEEQEVYLGEAVAEQIQRDYSIFEDPQLNSY